MVLYRVCKKKEVKRRKIMTQEGGKPCNGIEEIFPLIREGE